MVNLLTAGLALVSVMAFAAGAVSIPPNFQAFAGDADISDQYFDCDGTLTDFTSGNTQIYYDSRLFYPREVYSPNITEPNSSTIWSIGQQVIVSWETDDAPDDITNDRGKIVLGHMGDGEDEHLDLDHPLASGFDIRQGNVQIQVPDVTPGDDYILVLFGDSGNRSPPFSIELPQY